MPKENQITTDKRYTVIPRTLTFLTRNFQEVLLIKGSPQKKLWANQYNGIGGHIERGEDVISSAKREFMEETGLVIYDPWICAIVNIDVDEDIGVLMFILRTDKFSGKLLPSNEGKLEWIKLEQISSLPVVEDIGIILPKILQMKKEDPIISALYCYDENGQLHITFRS